MEFLHQAKKRFPRTTSNLKPGFSIYFMAESEKIIADIKQGKLKPVYFLMGEEPYFIDEVADYMEENVLDETEKSFNQLVLYGKDTSIEDIVSNAKRYPMMAERQVVIVREAQELSRTIENLAAYVENPQPTTVLIICYKYKTIDKRKKLAKIVQQNGVLLESKKLYENQVAGWIQQFLKKQQYAIAPEAAILLVEFLGNDLSRIKNELQKLFLSVPTGKPITPELIETYIGISKDFNNFELRKAIGENNLKKAAQILQYFSQNPKDNPIVVTTATLFAFFSQLMQYHGLSDQSQGNVAKVLKINPYFVKEYQLAARHYPMKRVSHAIAVLRDIDLKSKGLGVGNIPQGELLKEMLARLMN